MGLKLPFDLRFTDLYSNNGIQKIHSLFMSCLQDWDRESHEKLIALYDEKKCEDAAYSDLLVQVSPYLETFIGFLFGLQEKLKNRKAEDLSILTIMDVRRRFVQRQAVKLDISNLCFEEVIASATIQDIRKELRLTEVVGFQTLKQLHMFEDAFADAVLLYEKSPLNPKNITAEEAENRLNELKVYAAFATKTDQGRAYHTLKTQDGVYRSHLFKTPEKIDFDHLIKNTSKKDGVISIDYDQQHRRDGFALSDQSIQDAHFATSEIHYCIYCHKQGKDSCRTGIIENKSKTATEVPINSNENSDEKFKKNPSGIHLSGCPLDEKISEMNFIKSKGHDIAALAIAVVDNPMIAATGHRICNDCMKSCIYQKQDPVNIPLVETHILQNVLDLPFGFEIYSLLTRWNPLNIQSPMPAIPTGKKIMIAGMGPAGFTLAHYMLQQGHDVVGVDGLKIEPLKPPLIANAQHNFEPIVGWINQIASLEDRIVDGFGGVAEYGITVRWNKNYLKVLRVILERNSRFSLHGAVRLGGNITFNQASDLGFYHLALCIGAGQPRLLNVENQMARGVRAASDFLMALHQGAAFQWNRPTALQIRLPLFVVGGGLTAIDTATESLMYYVRQCEKFHKHFHTALNKLMKSQQVSRDEAHAQLRKNYGEEDHEIADEMLTHAEAFQGERLRARSEGRLPHFAPLIDEFGGVHVLYRKRLQDAPSYRLNHEEVQNALREGVRFVENTNVTRIHQSKYGAVEKIDLSVGEKISTRNAKTLLLALGTKPNTNIYDDLKNECDDETLESIVQFDENQEPLRFQAVDLKNRPVQLQQSAKPKDVHVMMTWWRKMGISFFGDLHQSFQGNVVRAMASAKYGAPVIQQTLLKNCAAISEVFDDIHKKMSDLFSAVIVDKKDINPFVCELYLKAPSAARNFKIGQFFKVQNYYQPQPQNGLLPMMEPLALSGLSVDYENDIIRTVILNLGASSKIAQNLDVGTKVALMGPNGAPAEMFKNENVLLICGGYYNPVMAGIGAELRNHGCHITYLAGFKMAAQCDELDSLKNASNNLIITLDEFSDGLTLRESDIALQGNILAGLQYFAKNSDARFTKKLNEIDKIIVLGAPFMLRAVQGLKNGELKPFLKPTHKMIGNISALMQCMMKGVCSQCMCEVYDEKTKQKKRIFTCAHQDQDIDTIDFEQVFGRLKQNTVQEQLYKNLLS